MRLLPIVALALVASWHAPRAHAQPDPNIVVPPEIVCKSGPGMYLEIGPRYDLVHFTPQAGTRPTDLAKLRPGACTSALADVALGGKVTPFIRVLKRAPGTPEGVGFLATYQPGGKAKVSVVFQPPCYADEPACQPTAADRDLLAQLQRLLDAIEKPGTVFELSVQPQPDLDIKGPAVRTLQIRYPPAGPR